MWNSHKNSRVHASGHFWHTNFKGVKFCKSLFSILTCPARALAEAACSHDRNLARAVSLSGTHRKILAYTRRGTFGTRISKESTSARHSKSVVQGKRVPSRRQRFNKNAT